jgi:hypothetical protein
MIVEIRGMDVYYNYSSSFERRGAMKAPSLFLARRLLLLVKQVRRQIVQRIGPAVVKVLITEVTGQKC